MMKAWRFFSRWTQGKLLDMASAPMLFAIFGIPFLMILVVAAIVLLAVYLIRRALRHNRDADKLWRPETPPSQEDETKK